MDTIRDFFFHMFFPWRFMANSASRIPFTISTAISDGEWSQLTSINAFCDALFGHFWAVAGPVAKMHAEVRVIPLLEGRVSNGKAHEEKVHDPVRGRVLEIGAGTGNWVDVFLKINTDSKTQSVSNESSVKRRVPDTKGITKIYGVEPHPESVKTLRRRVTELGMDNIYEVLPVGIESLDDPAAWTGTTIEPGSIDSIVTVLCLCSIPDQEQNIKALYNLLKPGGRWYVCEHVRVRQPGFGGFLLDLYQGFVNFFWAFFLGSCRLRHNTGKHLLEAGPWSNIDLTQPPDEPAYKVLPHIIGVLTK